MENLDNSLTCTNTYIFLKKYVLGTHEKPMTDRDVFKLVRPVTFSNSVKHIKINLYLDKTLDNNCCDNVVVFSEGTETTNCFDKGRENNDSTNIAWYQSKGLLQGFRDCYINKISASELW